MLFLGKAKKKPPERLYLRSDGFVQPGLSSVVSVVSVVSTAPAVSVLHSAAAGSLYRQNRVVNGPVVAIALNDNLLVGST